MRGGEDDLSIDDEGGGEVLELEAGKCGFLAHGAVRSPELVTSRPVSYARRVLLIKVLEDHELLERSVEASDGLEELNEN